MYKRSWVVNSYTEQTYYRESVYIVNLILDLRAISTNLSTAAFLTGVRRSHAVHVTFLEASIPCFSGCLSNKILA